MTTDDDLLRQVTAYLDECEGTTILPESILDDIRADLPTTPQVRPIGLARFFDMSTPLKIGIAAAVLAVVAFLGLNWMGTIQVGPPSASDRATPSTEASGDVTALPQQLEDVFLGPGKPSLEIDASWIDFRAGVLQITGMGPPIMTAAAGIAPDGRLRVETAVADECGAGDVGSYPYTLSPGGKFLTIENGADDCSTRADVLPGTYERPDCRDPNDECLGLLEAGTYLSHYFEPRPAGEWTARHGAMSFTVPDGWAAYGDWPATYGLTPRAEYELPQDDPGCYDCFGDRDTISIVSNPAAAAEDCTEATVPGIGSGIQDLADWLVGHSGLDASDPETSSINGWDAITVVVEGSSEWTGTCDEENPFVAVPVLIHEDQSHVAIRPGDRFQVTLIDLGDGNTVGVVVDAGDDADFDAFVEAARPIIDSFDFPPR